MLCSRCKKNRAVVFVKKLENGKQFDEGYCLSCAKELGIAPIDDMMQKMGLNAENMEDIEGQIADMMDMRDFETKHLITRGLEDIHNPFFAGIVEKNAF